jgi:thiol-disulfide isomerase/thioredoxin
MHSRRRSLCVALVLLLLAIPALAQSGDDAPDPAPSFHARTMDGEVFNNNTIKGKVVLLDFWTTWCQYCREEGSMVDSLGREFANKGLIVLAVNVLQSKKVVKKYLQANPRSSKIVLTDDTNLAAMYQANVYPIYVVIDRDGNIAGIQRGAGGERSLRNLLRRAGIGTEE